jgi:hypothetical protein
MTFARDSHMRRRDFLHMASVGGLMLGLGARPAAAEDTPDVHNMLMFGQQAVYFSHLPMFHGANSDDTEFVSPHRFQVILEAAFTSQQMDAYLKDRKAHPDARFYTIGPDELVLSRLFTPPTSPQLTSITCDVFRGHLEVRPKLKVAGLQRAQVKIARVVHGREFNPRASKPSALEYVLFGRGKELFLAHAIFAPPDFDQVLPVSFLSAELTADDLKKDIRMTVPDRQNVVAQRLRPGQRVDATLRIASGEPKKVQIEAGPAIYFEEGELLVPHTFDPTSEEEKEKQG